jgi:hypothetical protein
MSDESTHDEQRVTTVDGVAVLLRGGTVAEALAADAELLARLRAEDEAAAQLRADRAETRRLDLAEQRMRVADRARRLRRRQEREGEHA